MNNAPPEFMRWLRETPRLKRKWTRRLGQPRFRSGTVAARALEMLDRKMWYSYDDLEWKLCAPRPTVVSAMNLLYVAGRVQRCLEGRRAFWRVHPRKTVPAVHVETSGPDFQPLILAFNGYTGR